MRSHNRLALGSLIVALIATIGACVSFAADLPAKGKIAAPQPYALPAYTPPLDSPPAPETWQAHNWYVGLVGGHVWAAEDLPDTWHGGVVAGYLWRNASIGAGVEADYVVRDLGDFRLDDGVASLRARVGVFTGATFLYATTGVAETFSDLVPDGFSRGLVVGAGVERELAKNMALRLEALHYRHADDYFEWGDYGSTAVRGGLVVKF
jgi:opacity protein-like surface antigen